MVKVCYFRKRCRNPYHISDVPTDDNRLFNSTIADGLARLLRPVDWRAGDRVTVSSWPRGITFKLRVINIGGEFCTEFI